MIVSNQAGVLRLHSPSVAFSWMSDKIWDGLLGVQSPGCSDAGQRYASDKNQGNQLRYLLDSAINPFKQLCSEMSVDDDTVCVKKLARLENTFTTNQNRVHNFSNVAMKKKRYTCKRILKHYPHMNLFFSGGGLEKTLRKSCSIG